MAVSKNATKALSGDAAKSADNIRKISSPEESAPRTGADSVKRNLAQSPTTRSQFADKGLPFTTARELLRTPQGRAQLREMVQQLSPAARANLELSIVSGTRDPRSKADAVSLTPEGNAMLEVAFGDKPSPETIEFLRGIAPNSRAAGDVSNGTDLSQVPVDGDAAPKSKPDAPKAPGKEVKDQQSFRSTERIVRKDDGGFEAKHSDIHLDGQTNAAIRKGEAYEKAIAAQDKAIRSALLKKYGSQEGINAANPEEVKAYIDSIGAARSGKREQAAEAALLEKFGSPEGVAAASAKEKAAHLESLGLQPAYRPDVIRDEPSTVTGRGGALAAMRIPKERYTALLNRVAQIRDPHTPPTHDGSVGEGLELTGVPSSVFAPGGSKGVQGSSLATVRPGDYGDLMMLARARGIDPKDFDSPDSFARALVAGADQEGYNVTPITGSDRARTADTIFGLAGESGLPSEADAGTIARTFEPEAVRATKSAERAIMQEQVIEAIARKADAVFGHKGWGANYNANAGITGRTGAEASTEVGLRDGTTQDVANIPREGVRDYRGMPYGRPNQAGSVDVDGRPYEERLTSYEQERDAALRRVMQGDPQSGTGYFDPSQPLVRLPQPPQKPIPTDRPGMFIGEDVDGEDLVDFHAQRTFATGDEGAAGLKDGAAPSALKKGKEYPKTDRSEPQPKDKAYEDERDFAAYNRENREGTTQSELARRQDYYDNATGKIGQDEYKMRDVMELSPARSSEIRKEIRALIEANPKPGPEIIDRLTRLRKELQGAERLDSATGVKSFKDTGAPDGSQPAAAKAWDDMTDDEKAAAMQNSGVQYKKPEDTADATPVDQATDPNPADIQADNLEASATDLNPRADDLGRAEDVETKGDFDNTGTPKDQEDIPGAGRDGVDEPDLVPSRDPDVPADTKPADGPSAKKGSGWKKTATRAAMVGGGLGILGFGYNALHKAGQPKPHNWNDGGQGDGGPMLTPNETTIGFLPDAMETTYGDGIVPHLTKPEDRIRAIQATLRNFNLNPNTQTLQNWTN